MKHVFIGTAILAVLLSVSITARIGVERAAKKTQAYLECAIAAMEQENRVQAKASLQQATSLWKESLSGLKLVQEHTEVDGVYLELAEAEQQAETDTEACILLCRQLCLKLQQTARGQRLLAENIF